MEGGGGGSWIGGGGGGGGSQWMWTKNWGGGGGWGSIRGQVQGRCERRSEYFVKIKKTKKTIGGSGGQVWGVRVDVNAELKFLWKLKKKTIGGSGGLGLRGQCGCEWRIEVFVKIQNIYIFFFFWGGGGGVRGVPVWGGGGQGGCERRIEVLVKIQKQVHVA